MDLSGVWTGQYGKVLHEMRYSAAKGGGDTDKMVLFELWCGEYGQVLHEVWAEACG